MEIAQLPLQFGQPKSRRFVEELDIADGPQGQHLLLIDHGMLLLTKAGVNILLSSFPMKLANGRV